MNENHRKSELTDRRAYLINQTIEYLKAEISLQTSIPQGELREGERFDNFGMDSVVIMDITARMEEKLGHLSKTLFFEAENISELAEYLLQIKMDKIQKMFAPAQEERIVVKNNLKRKTDVAHMDKPMRMSQEPATDDGDIAIIGIAGRYPLADNPDEFWENLKNGRDCVTTIPENRWDHALYFSEDKNQAGKSYGRWGGFLKDVDKFDPSFFQMTPLEADFTDPQERIFLEETYHAFEDAGYSLSTIDNTRTGVFVGVMFSLYQLIENHEYGVKMTGRNNFASIANRVSYFFNLHGPSMAVDTMCSSSLTALHLACGSIRNREIDMAVVGGVNLSLHPNKYVQLSQGGFLSTDGRCRSFGAGGDGYVPGEGVGSIIIKPLRKAEADGDHIYAVIKGIGVNAGGRSKGYTVPNPKAQSELIQKVLTASGVSPDTISYVEAHGTGTALGDPIEINAISHVYTAHTDKRQYCAIGSVKSNIGHTESAAGMAAITKVILQMKHRKLVPSIHAETLNPYIDFAETPFHVQHRLSEWEQPIIMEGNRETRLPRRAAISAFGAGGANAHLILEEYRPEESSEKDNPVKSRLFLLSARNKTSLISYAQKLSDFLKLHPEASQTDLPELSLDDLEYTLQVGREAMSERLAIIAEDGESLRSALAQFLSGAVFGTNVRQGNVTDYADKLSGFLKSDMIMDQRGKLLQDRKLDQVSELWIMGVPFDFADAVSAGKRKRISLPTYPFERLRCWVTSEAAGSRLVMSDGEPGAEYIVPDLSPVIRGRSVQETEQADLPQFTADYLLDLFASVLRLPRENLHAGTDFEHYGLDSIYVKNINQHLEHIFGPLPATLLFTYKNIRILAKYFVDHHRNRLLSLITESDLPEQTAVKAEQAAASDRGGEAKKTVATDDAGRNDIAVIGMSGMMPQSEDLEDFFTQLRSGKDFITTVPAERWNYADYPEIEGHYGSFLTDVDKFDPQFFNIAPMMAQFMDPQERIMIQNVWNCFEDAGYTPQSMENQDNEEDPRGNVSVFIGTTFNEYSLYGAQDHVRGNRLPINTQIYSMANRISYLFNFGGPSLTVDTACSSSLYALHLACESISSGECRMAVAGGVNLSLHPGKYITLNWGKLLAHDGHCRSFGEGGTGYVPGEGCAAVLLKSLRQAEIDGDHIYAVIKGSAVNHGGKTYGYSVPNPTAQTQVIIKALQKADIHPRTISYVEAHGTGTALGDPIEVNALTEAYRQYTDDKQFCAIGSVKSNIGHPEAAAGVAQLVKVILQMKHKVLVQSRLNTDQINRNLHFEETPFFVQLKEESWERPMAGTAGAECKRRAGISSFGVGGVNVHVIVEEYEDCSRTEPEKPGTVLLPLSAKTEETLRQYIIKYRDWMERMEQQEQPGSLLTDMAFTLQTGRIELPHRVCFIVGDLTELKHLTEKYSRRADDRNIMVGTTYTAGRNIAADFITEPEQAAAMWVKGEISLRGTRLKKGGRRISLPTYPFVKETYWMYSRETDFESSRQAVQNDNRPDGSILDRLGEAYETERAELIVDELQHIFAEQLGFTEGRLPDINEGYFALGLESVATQQAYNILEERFNIELSDQVFFNFPSILKTAEYILTLLDFEKLSLKSEDLKPKDAAGTGERTIAELTDATSKQAITEMDFDDIVAQLEQEVLVN